MSAFDPKQVAELQEEQLAIHQQATAAAAANKQVTIAPARLDRSRLRVRHSYQEYRSRCRDDAHRSGAARVSAMLV
jgi:hypothetical protein